MKSLRRVAVAAAATAMMVGAGVVALVASPTPANAHGATVFPGSRQYFCWEDGLTANGQINPGNPACQSVLAQAGINPFYNWFANLDSNGQGRTVGYVPDGEICSGGNNGPFNFGPYDQTRTDWPFTRVTAGATYEFQSNNWAAHPGRFDVYVTRQGWNPSSPLTWSNLELIDTAVNPPQSGGPGGLNYYFWDTTLPSNRTGRHVIFIHWVRSDSPENFYSCSDVSFDGGNGEVIGIGGQPPPPPPPPPNTCPGTAPSDPGPPIISNITTTSARAEWGASTGCVTSYELVNVAGGANQVLATVTGNPPATSTTLSGLTPNTSYAISVRARNANTGAVSQLSDDAPFSTPGQNQPPPQGTCTVSYTITSQWNPGFQGDVTIRNTSGAGINGWELQWTFDNGQQISQVWGGVRNGTGANVAIRNESWNANIAANGGTASFGFMGSWSGNNAEPDEFTLNGRACTVQ